ncbi:MAG: PAS domain S-box protein [Thermoleophilia bacterium]
MTPASDAPRARFARTTPPFPSGWTADALLQAVGEGVAVYGTDGRMAAMNARLGDLTGFDPAVLEDSVLPPPWWPPESAESLLDDIRALWDGAPPVEGECTLLRSDGTNLVARVTWDAARDGSGRTLGVVVTVEDVTERLLIEEAWQEARRTHELLADNSTDVVVRVSSSLRFLYLSPAVERVLGYALAEISGARLEDFVHADDWHTVVREHLRLSRGADTATATFRIRHRDGHWVWIEAISHALRDGGGRLIEVQSSARDITSRRAVEEQSRKMAEELGFVARHAGDMISAHDLDGGFRTVSEASRALLGRAPDELVGTNPLDHVHTDDRERVRAGLRRLREGRAFIETLTYRVVRPDGSSLWLDTSIRPIHDDDGELSALIWVSRDATTRLAAEREASDRAERSELQAAEQAALRRVAMAVANQTESGPVLGMVAEEIPRLLEVDGGMVLRFDHDDEHATVVAASPRLPWRPDDRVLVTDGTALAALRGSGRTSRAAAPLESPGGHSAMVSAVAAPVRVDDALWGAAVAVGRPGGSVPAGAEARLERFAELVSVALVAHEQREQLREQALEDPLTGLANHRAFHERLRTEVSRAQRYGRPLSLALIDIDHFKRLNDLHGHQAGDAVLAALARMLEGNARASELVARVGGEEFAWILPETDGLTAMQALERARAAIGGAPLWQGERITVSAGVSDLSRARDAGELYRLADGALYWAKANGRDQVCLYSPEVVDSLSIEERANRLERTQTLVALRSLARAVDAKDASTKAHSERVASLSHRLALAIGWSPERAAMLRDAALLHDVGKLGVPDAVLFKPGGLEPAEYEVVKRHAALGAEITADALTPEQCRWIRHHHEHWDGGGYPDGLAGESIPEGARLIAVADAWDVMIRARHYGTVRPVGDAIAELERCAGAQFWEPAARMMARLARGPRASWAS